MPSPTHFNLGYSNNLESNSGAMSTEEGGLFMRYESYEPSSPSFSPAVSFSSGNLKLKAAIFVAKSIILFLISYNSYRRKKYLKSTEIPVVLLG